MCGSMVDIQSPTAEIRRGKKKKEEKIETTAVKCNGLPITMGGHNYRRSIEKKLNNNSSLHVPIQNDKYVICRLFSFIFVSSDLYKWSKNPHEVKLDVTGENTV